MGQYLLEWDFGGSSGGGSINVFYDSLENCNWSGVTAVGGATEGQSQGYYFRKGGDGSVTFGSVSSGTFVKNNL